MRNVSRPKEPQSLRHNARKWTMALIKALRKKKRDKRLLATLFKKYNCIDVRKTLDSMYNNLCCYCEAEIGVVAFPHIEHRKPKSKFPELTYAWENLHLGCPVCNKAKGINWDEKTPILDAVRDTPIEKHLKYDSRDVLGVVRSAKTPRGEITINHADLNREKLRTARTKVALSVWGLVGELNSAPKSPRHSQLCLELQMKTTGPYGSLVKWLLDTYLRAT